MPRELKLTPSESVTVQRNSPDVLEVEAHYAPHGSPPPSHFHPAQDERFEVLEGTLRARLDGQERDLRVGDTLDIPRGTVHQMWNAGGKPARVRWRTSPAGRTLEWFEDLDRLQRAGRVRRDGTPGPLALSSLLPRYRDVIRFVLGPATPAAYLVLRALSPVARLRGY